MFLREFSRVENMWLIRFFPFFRSEISEDITILAISFRKNGRLRMSTHFSGRTFRRVFYTLLLGKSKEKSKKVSFLHYLLTLQLFFCFFFDFSIILYTELHRIVFKFLGLPDGVLLLRFNASFPASKHA